MRPAASPPPDDGQDGLPPNDTEAEQEVLGALLIADRDIAQIVGVLAPDDFFIGTHRKVFAAMLTLHERDQPTDVSLVRAELEQRGDLEGVGGPAMLAAWINATPTAVNLLHYASLVAEKATRRRLLRASGEVARAAYDAPTAEEAQAQAMRAVTTASASTHGRVVDVPPVAEAVWDEVGAAADRQAEGEVVGTGLLTGFRDLDDRTGGLARGELVLLAARPSMGKSALAAQIASHAGRAGHRTLIFTLEMGRKDVVGRMIWQRARVNGQMALRGLLSPEELQKVSTAVGDFQDARIRLDDTAALPVQALAARAKSYQAQHPDLALVVVDYLQLLRAPRQAGNKTAEVTDISQALQGLARETGVPVLACSQLNRAVEHRSDPQPYLSDLRDSGSLEQDADQVWLLWRESRESKVAYVEVAKHRNGPTGKVELFFEPTQTRFDPLETRFGT